MNHLKLMFLTKFIARQSVEILRLKKKLQKDIRLQELVVELGKLEIAKPATKDYQFIMMNKFVASALLTQVK